MKLQKPIKVILEELADAESEGRKIFMNPIYDIYDQVDNRYFLQVARDYIWFGETYECLKGGER